VPRVFVSCAAELEPAERVIADRWLDALAGLGLATVGLTREDYRVPPWGQLRSLVGSCQGAVVLGFRRSPTSWSQVEAGLAIMAGLPVLVAAEDGVAGGVFDPETRGEGVTGVGLHEFGEPALQAWLSAVRG
jgi:hypothetical protein